MFSEVNILRGTKSSGNILIITLNNLNQLNIHPLSIFYHKFLVSKNARDLNWNQNMLMCALKPQSKRKKLKLKSFGIKLVFSYLISNSVGWKRMLSEGVYLASKTQNHIWPSFQSHAQQFSWKELFLFFKERLSSKKL